MQSWYQPNPYGLLPKGNARSPQDILARFGSLSWLVPDEAQQLDLMLEAVSFLDPRDASQLSATCSGWYVFLHVSDYWKRLYCALFPERLRFEVDWKTSVIRQWIVKTPTNSTQLVKKSPVGGKKMSGKSTHLSETFTHRAVNCSHPLFHDTLFQSWMCSLLPADYKLIKTGRLPSRCLLNDEDSHHGEKDGAAAASSGRDSSRGAAHVNERFAYKSKLKAIPHVDGSSMSVDEFQSNYEKNSIPVILQGIATQWPMYRILNQNFYNMSSPELFRSEDFGKTKPMRCEHTTMTVEEYLAYAKAQHDERPIYMFDAEFADVLKTEQLFAPPQVFAADDFFKVLGSDRPKYRWLIAGPARGGSSYHVDPNFTHAWNACLTGRKRWLLFPPNRPPPGCYPSGNMSDVTTSVSLTEWLLNFYAETLTSHRDCGYEGICETGEIMFVPAGWWHFVINLEDSVALTQNYVSKSNLPKVIQFLRSMKGSISGINEDSEVVSSQMIDRRREGFADSFVQAMREQCPQQLQKAEDAITEAANRRRKRPREHKVELLGEQSEGFSFTF